MRHAHHRAADCAICERKDSHQSMSWETNTRDVREEDEIRTNKRSQRISLLSSSVSSSSFFPVLFTAVPFYYFPPDPSTFLSALNPPFHVACEIVLARERERKRMSLGERKKGNKIRRGMRVEKGRGMLQARARMRWREAGEEEEEMLSPRE